MHSRKWPLGLIFCVVLAGCQMPQNLMSKAAPNKLSTITYQYTDATTTAEGQMLIDPDGRIRVVEKVGASTPVVHSADTYLTEDEIQRVLRAFKGWHDLKPSYPVSFGPIFTISFEGYKVEAADGDNAAPQLRATKAVLDAIAGAALLTAPHPTLPPKPEPAAAQPVAHILDTDIDYHFEMDLTGQTLHRRITVSRDDGLLTLQEQSTGSTPTALHDPSLNVKIHLSRSQLETLANTLGEMPAGDQRYPGIDKGPYFSIKYDGRTIISGGLPDTPGNVKSAQQLIEGYSQDAKRFPED